MFEFYLALKGEGFRVNSLCFLYMMFLEKSVEGEEGLTRVIKASSSAPENDLELY